MSPARKAKRSSELTLRNTGTDDSDLDPLSRELVALTAIIFSLELIFTAGQSGWLNVANASGWRNNAITDYGFFPPIIFGQFSAGNYLSTEPVRLVTFPLIHYSFSHALFSVVFILAIGKFIGQFCPGSRVVAIFFLSSIGGAFFFGLVLNTDFPLVGGSPGFFGLIGSFLYLLFRNFVSTGRIRRTLITMPLFLIGSQIFIRLLFGGPPLWIADLGGMLTGFALAYFLVPGGFIRVVNQVFRIRRAILNFFNRR